jgi:uncharacterized protein
MKRSATRLRLSLLATSLVSLSCGCTVFSDYNASTEDARLAFKQGNFVAATTEYSEDLDASLDSLLYHVEAGLSAEVGKGYMKSFKLFDGAYKIVEEYQERAIVSASDALQTAGSFLVNEKTIPYTGAVFEQLMIQSYQARNLFLLGRKDQVLTEVLRCYDIQTKARKIYEDELRAAEGQSEKDADESGLKIADFDAEMRKAYKVPDNLNEAGDVYDPAYIRYVNSFLRDATADRQSDYDDVLIDLKFVADRFGNEELVRRDMARVSRLAGDPAGAKKWEAGLAPLPRNAGSVCLLFESGMAPRKEEFKITFMTPTGAGAASIAIPLYKGIPNLVKGATLVVGDQVSESLMLTNLESVAFRYFKDRLPLMIAKMVIRVAAKVALTEGGTAVLEHQANTSEGEASLIWRGLSYLWRAISSIWNVVSEQADLRCWRTLPQTLSAARVYLPPGTYPARVILRGSGGSELNTVDLGMITIAAGKHRLVNARAIGTRVHWDLPEESYDLRPEGAAASPGAPQPGPDETVTTDVLPPADPGEAPRETNDPVAPDENSNPVAPVETTETPTGALGGDDGDPMGAIARSLGAGSPINLILQRRGAPAWNVNTTVEELIEGSDKKGRTLTLTTPAYTYEGRPHGFNIVIRDGQIEQVELLAENNGSWARVSKKVFSFKAKKRGNVAIDGAGGVTLTRQGHANSARGVSKRLPAVLTIRSGHDPQGAELFH